MIIDSKNRMNGKFFVGLFLLIIALTAIIFAYSMYRSYLSRPQIKIEDEK